MHRSRTMALEDMLEDEGLEHALAERRAEAVVVMIGTALIAMEDAGFIIGSYIITFAVVGCVGVADRASRSAAVTTSRRRRQVLDLTRCVLMTDLSPYECGHCRASACSGRRWMSLVVLGLVLVAGGVIVTQFLRSAVDYYCNVDEIGKRSGCDADRRLRLQGVVEQGTVVHTGGFTDFRIGFNGADVPVHYDGEPGGIFKECIPGRRARAVDSRPVSSTVTSSRSSTPTSTSWSTTLG